MHQTPEIPPNEAYDAYRRIYLQWLGIYKQLEQAYRGIVQPQKRKDARSVLELVVSRLVLYRSLVAKWHPVSPDVTAARVGQPHKTIPWNFIDWDDLLIVKSSRADDGDAGSSRDIILSPETIVLPVPQYFSDGEASKRIHDREKLLEIAANYLSVPPEVYLEKDAMEHARSHYLAKNVVLGDNQESILLRAARILQTTERGRQSMVEFATLRTQQDVAKVAVSRAVTLQSGILLRSITDLMHANEKFEHGAITRVKDPKMQGPGAARMSSMALHYTDDEEEDLMDENAAAITIQRIARGYIIRKYVKEIRQNELVALGIHERDSKGLARLETLAGEEIEARCEVQNAALEKEEAVLNAAREEFRRTQGPSIRDSLRHERSQWLLARSQISEPPMPKAIDEFYTDKEAGGPGQAFLKEKLTEDLAAAAKGKNNKPKPANNNKKKPAVVVEEAEVATLPNAVGSVWSRSTFSLLRKIDSTWGIDLAVPPVQKIDFEALKAAKEAEEAAKNKGKKGGMGAAPSRPSSTKPAPPPADAGPLPGGVDVAYGHPIAPFIAPMNKPKATPRRELGNLENEAKYDEGIAQMLIQDEIVQELTEDVDAEMTDIIANLRLTNLKGGRPPKEPRVRVRMPKAIAPLDNKLPGHKNTNGWRLFFTEDELAAFVAEQQKKAEEEQRPVESEDSSIEAESKTREDEATDVAEKSLVGKTPTSVGPDLSAKVVLHRLLLARVVNKPRPDATFDTFLTAIPLQGSEYWKTNAPEQRYALGTGTDPKEQYWVFPEPSLFAVKEAVIANVALPLGSDVVRSELRLASKSYKLFRERCPRSVLLYGPKGSGKSHLVQAIANSAGAMIINLSPGSVMGKASLNDPASALHMSLIRLGKYAPQIGPILVYIDEIEAFLAPKKRKKKSTKTASNNILPDLPDFPEATRWKKALKSYLEFNEYKTAERVEDPLKRPPVPVVPPPVMVVASTSRPDVLQSEVNFLRSAFDSFMYLPTPDHATRMLIWKQAIVQMLLKYYPCPSYEAQDTSLELQKKAKKPQTRSSSNSRYSAEPVKSQHERPLTDPMEKKHAKKGSHGQDDAAAKAKNSNALEPSSANIPEIVEAEPTPAPEPKALPRLSDSFTALPLSPTAMHVENYDSILNAYGRQCVREINFTALAIVSEGYTAGSIRKTVALTLTDLRLSRIVSSPLQEAEFIDALARQPKVYGSETSLYIAFTDALSGTKDLRVKEVSEKGKRKK